ncbi:glycoside hydrolase family 3 C-terminal domain-containing protein [Demequina rhizosphaerae]|uniref:glycoside hydrolase family 3 C-terminal domain-containing protein n=1 Tax=Demequina rhizosphaerae TaxID=1638985 RepID=UPI000A981CCB|nr:glycoside hydrolase family 3 C-terminal domain-containing protein [Demequina rhizosphaerae]
MTTMHEAPVSLATAPDVAAARIAARLTREQKLSLVSGADFWNTRALEAEGVPSIMLTDGPHGLRKQAGEADHVGLNDSVPATCFPPAVTLGSTWDPALIEQVGAALGRETRTEKVGVLLGPGLNIKRHPAGGRGFEYFSEDPLLSGKAAAAMVRGIQSEGVGACVKHFAANNQEAYRMRLDTVVDERTLREIYLTGFEIAVKESAPWTVMCAYNLVNGEHAGESRALLTEILRDEWGFEGLVVSDWLAVADRTASLDAGLDLEMPASHGAWDKQVGKAIDAGTLDAAALDGACTRVIALALRVVAERAARDDAAAPDHEAHHALARTAAAAGTVLLANDGVLPLAAAGRVALVGAFAETPRYQGAGSSLVNPTRLDSAREAMAARLGGSGTVLYAPGYDAETGATTPDLVRDAREAAAAADVAVVMVGLPASYESEGFDRKDLRLPADHEELIRAVASANPRTVVVLSNGGAVEIDWADGVGAIIESYLGGQAGGSALVDVLFGDAEPGGRLAESIPVRAQDLASHSNFANHPTQVQYRESLYVGYRFHDTWGVDPRFCFGHGLSYTTFEYSDMRVTGEGTDVAVSVTVTNTGDRAGSDVVQLYVHALASTVHRPEQELKGFRKVHLEAGESTTVSMTLEHRSFAVYDVAASGWRVEDGAYEIRVGSSSRLIRSAATVDIVAAETVSASAAPVQAIATSAEFAALLGRPVPEPRPLTPLHLDSTIADLAEVRLGGALQKRLLAMFAEKMDLDDADPAMRAMLDAIMGQMPLRALVLSSEGKLSFGALEAALGVLNLLPRKK